jgi:hypothetical protein
MSALLRKEFGPEVRRNLRASMLYAFDFAERLLSEGKTRLTGEIILRQFRDVWLYRENALLSDCAENAAREMSPLLPESDFVFLHDLEKAARKEKDYAEFIVHLDEARARRLLNAAKEALESSGF